MPEKFIRWQMKPEEVDNRNPMYQPHVCFYRLGTDFLTGMTDDCGPCLKFGEFGPTKMYKNECFTLDLGTGRTWNISFDFWVDGINTDNPVVHSSLYVDGEKMDFPLAEIRLD